MRFLLDTNICIYIIKEKPPLALEKFRTLDPAEVGISSITIAELEYGVYPESETRTKSRGAPSVSIAFNGCSFRSRCNSSLRADSCRT